jgi:hypothetical protein
VILCGCISAFTHTTVLPCYYTLQYHFIPALAKYQPKVYSTLLFSPATQTSYSEDEAGLEFFDEEF